jgi:polar amino acid transport system permease protein
MGAAWEVFVKQMITLEGYKKVLEGLGNTALIAIFGLLIGMVIGCLLATCKILPKSSVIVKILSGISDVYVAIFRGTPMVVQLLLIHFVLFPLIGIQMPTILEAILAFGFNSGAYVSEIMRGGILSVDIGQTEAGRALGLNYGQTMMRIVLPQAIKNVVPTLGNEFIALLKETSVVSFITVVDLTKSFQNIANSTYEYIIPYIVLALIYLVLVLAVTGVIKLIERRLRAGDRR